MRKTWSRDEEEYLRKNYQSLPDDVIAGVLKKSRQSVSVKAFRMGLQKDAEAMEINQPKKQVKYRKETPLLADIICFYHRRNMNVGDIAKDLHCPPRQVREILERCMDNGMYERYAKAENGAFEGNGEWKVENGKLKMENGKFSIFNYQFYIHKGGLGGSEVQE